SPYEAVFSSDNEMLFETSSSHDSLSDEESQQNVLQLYIGLTFNTWDDVDTFIESYRKCKGFSFWRSRTDLHSDYSSIRRRSYECSYSRAHKAKKAIDITKQCKHSSGAVNYKHTHEMNPIVVQTAPRY
ncbi:33715_t:CDS:2, partial [Racocetra persica]